MERDVLRLHCVIHHSQYPSTWVLIKVSLSRSSETVISRVLSVGITFHTPRASIAAIEFWPELSSGDAWLLLSSHIQL